MVSKEELLAAESCLANYHKTFPSFDDIEDDVIKADIERCVSIIEKSKQENKPAPQPVKKQYVPWFLKGKKSQYFKWQLEQCLEQDDRDGINQLREEIGKMYNKYARQRYQAIFDYVMTNFNK